MKLMASLAACLAGACAIHLDEEQLGTPLAGRAEPLCVAPRDAGTLHQAEAVTLRFPDGAYVIYGETLVGSEGTPIRTLDSSGATLPPGASPCDLAAYAFVRDGSGELAPILRLTPAEEEENESSTTGTLRVWPISGFVHEGGGVLYYQKVRFRDYFNIDVIGVGVAHVQLGGVAARAVPGRFPDEPTLLWRAPQADWGQDAFVAEDGLAYVYGCARRSAFDQACRVARVDPARAADPGAYEYWDGSAWAASPDSAAEILAGAGTVSVAWNRHLGAYLAVHAPPLSDDVVARVAPAPQGPWSPAERLFTGEASAEFWIGGVRQQPAFAADGDRALAVTYFASPAGGPAGTRVVRYELP